MHAHLLACVHKRYVWWMIQLLYTQSHVTQTTRNISTHIRACALQYERGTRDLERCGCIACARQLVGIMEHNKITVIESNHIMYARAGEHTHTRYAAHITPRQFLSTVYAHTNMPCTAYLSPHGCLRSNMRRSSRAHTQHTHDRTFTPNNSQKMCTVFCVCPPMQMSEWRYSHTPARLHATMPQQPHGYLYVNVPASFCWCGVRTRPRAQRTRRHLVPLSNSSRTHAHTQTQQQQIAKNSRIHTRGAGGRGGFE